MVELESCGSLAELRGVKAVATEMIAGFGELEVLTLPAAYTALPF